MEITIPHNYEPRDYQLPLLQALDSGIKRAVITWHRRAGKDKTCWNYLIRRAFEEVGTYYYFLPTYSQAKKVVWDNIDNDGFRMIHHIPPEGTTNTNSQELKIELVNGSIIQLFGADSFEKSGVGTNPIGVVFSEYSINDPNVWSFVRPILAANGGWAIFNFTPRGTNHAYEILEYAKNNDKWFSQVLTVDDTGVMDAEALEEERKSMPEDLFLQEYYCKFIEGAGQFFKGVEKVCVGEEMKPDPSHRYQIGVDLAKYQDYTAISVFDLVTFQQVSLERFNKIDYNLQKAKIEAAAFKWNKANIWIDSTGVGEPIYDDLAHSGLKIVPFKFTQTTREQLLRNLSISLEQNKFYLLNDETLKGELKSFQYELTQRGTLKIRVPEGLHDDTVFATALSVWELPNAPRQAAGLDPVRYLTRNYKQTSNQTSYE